MPKGWTVKVLGVFLALVLTVGLAACGSGGSSQPEAAKAAAPASKPADKAAAKIAAKPSEKDVKKAPSLKDMKKPALAKSSAAVRRAPVNLVSNGTFTSWMKDGRPKGWRGSASMVAKAKGDKPGSDALQLKPSKKGDSTLSRPVKGSLAGKTLALAVTAKVQSENALGIAVDYKTAAGPQTEFWYFSKSPSWKKETKKVALPADAAADSVSVRLVLRDSAKPAEIAAVSLTPAS